MDGEHARGISSFNNVSANETAYFTSIKKGIRTASVGAGAEIKQDIKSDGLGVDGWKDEPSSIIRLYFCFEEQFRQILSNGGVVGVQTKKSGFMDNMPVG